MPYSFRQEGKPFSSWVPRIPLVLRKDYGGRISAMGQREMGTVGLTWA
jgi:acetyl-CoA carboxylase carboxyltransferase component